MKNSFAFLLVAILVVFSSCKKVYDYVEQHPAQAAKLCRIEAVKIDLYGTNYVHKIKYNSAGNPTDILQIKDATNFNPDYHFRYDNQNRLTDYYQNYRGATGVLLWNRYSYPDKRTIVDTEFNYVGSIDDVEPPHSSEEGFDVTTFKLDGKGRIIKATLKIMSGSEFVTTYNYDDNGNLIIPNYQYDDNINIYRTNNVWMLVFRNYSVNNAMQTKHYMGFGRLITEYNSFGLPTRFKSFYDQRTTPIEGSLLGLDFYTAKVEYSCDDCELPEIDSTANY